MTGRLQGFNHICQNDIFEKGMVIAFFTLIGYYFYNMWTSPSLILVRDTLPTFDTFWYFHHRLRAGALAQWNPYYFLGSIAVQWNFVPITIFTPLLLIFELTPVLFRDINILSNILICLSIYLSTRILGYRRHLAVFALVVILINPVFMWDIWSIVLCMPFIMFPIVFALLIRCTDRRFLGLYVIFLALSLTGSRLEYIVHETVFITISVIVLAFWMERRAALRFLLYNAIILAVALLANSWHMTLTMNSALESGRVSAGADLHKLLDPALWRWIFITIAYQPYLIFMLVNAFIYAMIKNDRGITAIKVLSIILIETALIVLFVKVRNAAGTGSELMTSLNGYGIGTLRLWRYAIPGLILWHINEEVTLKRTILLMTSAFCGLYIIDHLQSVYSQYSMSVNPLIYWILAPGVTGLFKKGQFRIISIYIAFAFFGLTLKFFLYEVFKIIWVEDRDFIYIIPILCVISAEGVNMVRDAIIKIVSRYSRSESLSMLIPFSKVVFLGLLTCAVLSLSFKQSLDNLRYTMKSSQNYMINRLVTAYETACRLKTDNTWQRRYLPNLSYYDSFMYNKTHDTSILPDYLYSSAGIKNVSYHFYSGEIPELWWKMFEPDRDFKRYNNWHPEASRQFLTYVRYYYYKDKSPESFDYGRSVFLEPDLEGNNMFRELTALSGSNTKRAFITGDVIRLADYRTEYNAIKGWLDSGRLLLDRVTTSDRDFRPWPEPMNRLIYSLDFIEDYPEYIELKTVSDRDGYLVLMDTYSKGWSAFVDGLETKIYRGYIGLRLIKLPAGEHMVKFRYNCPDLKIRFRLAMAAWIVIIGFNIITGYRILS